MKSKEYRDPCVEKREISAFERNLILGATAMFKQVGRRWGKCDPQRCQNTDEYRLEIGGELETLAGCPHRFITQRTREYLELYGHYKNGHMVQEGGVFDQPAEYLFAMRIIGTTVAELEEEEYRKRAQGASKHGKR